jgi:N-acyl-D-aspartate/D-glutamate deacylase
MLDTLIVGGLVFDGLGSPPQPLDVGIQDGKIKVMAPRLDRVAKTIIDATGLWVTPGFLDIHTHYDLELEIAPGLSESVRHGVTSVVIGNCSLSVAIGDPEMLAAIFQRVETLSHRLIAKWLQQSLDWYTPAGYLTHLRQLPLGPNVAPLFGHSALRAHVMGLERSLTLTHPSRSDLVAMQEIAASALDAGFLGISIDMFPWHRMTGVWRGHSIPSQHARYREYAQLANLCRQRDRVFQVTPNLRRPASFLEILAMGSGIGQRPLRVTVLSALDIVHIRPLWRGFGPFLEVWNRYLGGNMRFQTLTEPFTIYADGPLTPLFEEFGAGVQLINCDSRSERQALWQSPQFRQQFRRDWLNPRHRSFHRQLHLMDVVSCPNPDWSGLSMAVIAQSQAQDPLDWFMAALQTYDTDLRWVATGANDRLQPRLAMMKHPYILPGFTDAGAHVRNLGYYDGALSLLKQAVTTQFLTPEAAIARVTGEPARWFRLETGILEPGAQADLVLIQPQALAAPISPMVDINDPLLDGEPRLVKRGSQDIIQAVYIRGVPVVRQGEVNDQLGQIPLGRVLVPRDSTL